MFLQPEYLTIISKNLEIAEAEINCSDRKEFISQHRETLVTLIMDFINLIYSPTDWLDEVVAFTDPNALKRLKEKYPNQGVLFISGHFNSFELIPTCLSKYGRPISILAREHNNPFVNKILLRMRSRYGVGVIKRKGGLRKVLKDLKEGRDIGFLFDQNVVRKDAIFPKWFGLEAATTIAVGSAAFLSGAPIAIVGLYTKGNKREFDIRELDIRDILNSDGDRDAKVFAITQRAVDAYQEVIKNDPPAWFWLHRRWKTRPDPMDPGIY